MVQDFEYRYASASTAQVKDGSTALLFAHCSEIIEENNVPCFFYGQIRDSFVASKCMSALARTVGSHYALTPSQIFYLKDPIVSVGNKEMRWEAFSSCNSVYARIDILENGIDGEFLQSGCTNIDFNSDTVRAFNTVTQKEKLSVSIGSKEVNISTERSSTQEKKVKLPNRWIKGLGNVQVYLSSMELAFTLTKIEATQLFNTLPKTAVKGNYYLYKSGLSYQFSPSSKPDGLKIGGVHRLNLLQNLLLLTESVSFYKSDDEQCVAVLLRFGNIRMSFLFSESVYRGFSGEGKNLEALTEQVSEELILGINSFFKTNEVFHPTLISIEHDIPLTVMETLQSSLSSIGLLGYELGDRQFFYRRLPFKLERLKSFNPRIQNAIKLVRDNEVTILQQTDQYIKAEVKGSGDVLHMVIANNDVFQCTCNWYTANKNNRGLCKHILAVKMTLSK